MGFNSVFKVLTIPPYWMCHRVASFWCRRTQVLCSFDVRGLYIPPQNW